MTRCLPDFVSPITKLLQKKQFRKCVQNARFKVMCGLPPACTSFFIEILVVEKAWELACV